MTAIRRSLLLSGDRRQQLFGCPGTAAFDLAKDLIDIGHDVHDNRRTSPSPRAQDQRDCYLPDGCDEFQKTFG